MSEHQHTPSEEARPSAARPAPGGSSQQARTGSFFDSVRRMGVVRTDQRWMGGVASGLGRRWDIDPLLIRGVLVVATIFGGLGLLLYGLAWALLPEERDGRIHAEEAIRGRFDSALAGALVMVVIGLARPTLWWNSYWLFGGWGSLLMVLALAAVLLVGYAIGRRDETDGAPQAPPPSTTPAPPESADASTEMGARSYAAPLTSPLVGQAPGGSSPKSVSPQNDTTDSEAPDNDTTDSDAPNSDIPEAGPGWQHSSSAATAADEPGSATGSVASQEPSASEESGPEVPTGPPPPPTAYQLPAAGAPSPEPGAGGTATAARPAPTPTRPRIPGPGTITVRVVVGLALLTAAVLLLVGRFTSLDASLWILAGGAILVVLGLGIVISGLRGRRAGWLGGWSLFAALLVLPLALTLAVAPHVRDAISLNPSMMGDTYWSPDTPAEFAGGHVHTAGSVVVSLGDLPADATSEEPARVALGAGIITVDVPAGMDVAIEVQGTGALRVDSPEPWYREGQQIRAPYDQALIASTTTVRPTAATGPADIDLIVGVGAGDIVIREVRPVDTGNDTADTTDTPDTGDDAAGRSAPDADDSTQTTSTTDEE